MAWSKRGLETIIEESGQVICETLHFTLFAVFLEALLAALECSNAEFLTGPALQDMVNTFGQWATRPAALLVYVVVVIHLGLMVGSLEADIKRGYKPRVVHVKDLNLPSTSCKDRLAEIPNFFIAG